ncbi:MAG: hypothetical protein RL409_926 [Gemmatimonadota bacterium]|jgi:hypothetical protein
MAAAFGARYVSNTHSGTSIVIDVFSTPNSGDFLLAVVFSDEFSTQATLTGWTLLRQASKTVSGVDSGISVFWKISDGTETSVTFDVSPTNAITGYVLVCTGADTSGPQGHATSSGAAGSAYAGQAVSTVPTGGLTICYGGNGYTTTESPKSVSTATANWTERVDDDTPSSGERVCYCYTNGTNTGTVTGPTITSSHDYSSYLTGSFYLAPASPITRSSMMHSL